MKRGIPIFLILIFLYSINCQNTSVSNVANYTDKKYIALTFDDGPSKVYTPKLLDGLKKRNVKATFFILGLQANSYPNIVKRIQDEGHVIGNHTYHHYNLSRLNSQKAEKEINDTSNLIYSITGFFPKYFRPSYGSIRKKQIESIDLKMIRWTLDSKD